MLIQLRDKAVFDTGFDDADDFVTARAHDHDDEQDLEYVTRNLETDFGLEDRCSQAQRWLKAASVIAALHASETPAERNQRRIAHAKDCMRIIEHRL